MHLPDVECDGSDDDAVPKPELPFADECHASEDGECDKECDCPFYPVGLIDKRVEKNKDKDEHHVFLADPMVLQVFFACDEQDDEDDAC